MADSSQTTDPRLDGETWKDAAIRLAKEVEQLNADVTFARRSTGRLLGGPNP